MTDALSRMLNDPSTRMAMNSLQNNRERIIQDRVNAGEEENGRREEGNAGARRVSSDNNSQGEEEEEDGAPATEGSARLEEDIPTTPRYNFFA